VFEGASFCRDLNELGDFDDRDKNRTLQGIPKIVFLEPEELVWSNQQFDPKLLITFSTKK
jgi:hypothetical protein